MLPTASRRAPPLFAGALALLVVACLVECATEQRINRGSKTNLVEKVNGWRSQRGGSCLSYGHSCWGAHGKRSGKPAPASAAGWYISRLLRRMPSWNKELERAASSQENRDLNALFRAEATDDDTARTNDGEDSTQEVVGIKRTSEGIPMIDDDVLNKAKFWQIMKEAAEEK